MHLHGSRPSGRSSAHLKMASRAGHSACPHSVRLYSTFGGTCGYAVITTKRSRPWRLNKMSKKYPFSCDPNEFKGKRVLVTGGTKGMGEAIVRRFVLSGALVATTPRSPSSQTQTSVLFVKADIGTAS